jgi:hypothetical protein
LENNENFGVIEMLNPRKIPAHGANCTMLLAKIKLPNGWFHDSLAEIDFCEWHPQISASNILIFSKVDDDEIPPMIKVEQQGDEFCLCDLRDLNQQSDLEPSEAIEEFLGFFAPS